MRFFTPALEFDDIVRINVLDGVRVYFRNGDVAHIRPSGNAPQLRIYANSDSQARADQIAEPGCANPTGSCVSWNKRSATFPKGPPVYLQAGRTRLYGRTVAFSISDGMGFAPPSTSA